MSIADKLIYLNGTKEKLKESINNIGGSITDETTFRAYATELDNIYSSLPKTTGEGSNLSLTTLKGRINVDDILGDTTQEGTPTPDSPQDINVVTGEQEVLVRGKQLFDGIFEQGIISSDDGTNKNGASQNNYMRSKNYIPITPSTAIIISTPNTSIITDSLFVYYYDENKAFITYSSASYNSTYGGYVFTVNASASYIRFRPRYQTNDTTIQFLVEYRATSTTSASEWQPYQEQTKILHLGDIELAKIGTYQDRIYKNNDKWYIEKNIGKRTLDGTEGWSYNGDSAIFYASFDQRKANTDTTQTLYSDKLFWNGNFNSIANAGSGMSKYQIATNNNGTSKNIFIKNTDYQSGPLFKSWLEGLKPIMLYQMATPTYEEITNETLIEELNELEKMMSYSGTTNINISGNLPMILSVSALKGE